MKKQSFTIIRKGILFSILTGSLLINSFVSHATVEKDPIKKADIQYVGKSNKYLTFNIGYTNPEQKKCVLQLLDKASNEVLYEREFKDSAFTKNIYLLVENTSCTVTFRISSGKQHHEQSFNIDTETRVEDQLLVTKL
jgi:hypothetical protein